MVGKALGRQAGEAIGEDAAYMLFGAPFEMGNCLGERLCVKRTIAFAALCQQCLAGLG